MTKQPDQPATFVMSSRSPSITSETLNAMSLAWFNLVIGRPAANREAEGRKLRVLTGVAGMGLDELDLPSTSFPKMESYQVVRSSM